MAESRAGQGTMQEVLVVADAAHRYARALERQGRSNRWVDVSFVCVFVVMLLVLLSKSLMS